MAKKKAVEVEEIEEVEAEEVAEKTPRARRGDVLKDTIAEIPGQYKALIKAIQDEDGEAAEEATNELGRSASRIRRIVRVAQKALAEEDADEEKVFAGMLPS